MGRQSHGFADIAEQHVRPLDVFQRTVFHHTVFHRTGQLTSGRSGVSLRDRLLDKAFLQADSQISGHDFHDVLGFQRRRPREQIAHLRGLGCGSAGRCDLPEGLGDFENSQSLPRALGKNFSSYRAKISMLAVRRGQRRFRLPGQFRDHAPQQPSTELQSSFFPRGKCPS